MLSSLVSLLLWVIRMFSSVHRFHFFSGVCDPSLSLGLRALVSVVPLNAAIEAFDLVHWTLSSLVQVPPRAQIYTFCRIGKFLGENSFGR